MAGRPRVLVVVLAAPALWLSGPFVGIASADGASSTCPAWATASPARTPAPATTTPTTTTTTPTTTTTTPAATTTTPAATTTMVAAPLVRDDAASVAGVLVAPRAALVSVTATAVHVPVVVEYRSPGQAYSCTPLKLVGGTSAAFTISALRPGSRYGFRVAAKVNGSVAFGPLKSFVTLPSGRIAEGVLVGSIGIGRMTAGAATQRLARNLASSITFTYAGAIWHASAAKLGLSSNATELVRRALLGLPGTRLPAPAVTVKGAPVRAYVAEIARRFDHAGNTASVRLVGKHAEIAPVRPGVRIDRTALVSEIVRALHSAGKARLAVPVEKTAVPQPKQRAVVVRLGSQTLTAYVDGRAILTTPVTTGRPALPTPIGSFSVQFKDSPYVFHSPWPLGSAYYYPPTPVTWAMEFYDGDFLHDDPAEPAGDFGADSQNGYFASHGCVHVPHSVMAFLYTWLPVGAPVIVAES